VGQIVYSLGSGSNPNYTTTTADGIHLTISGTGITNNSGHINALIADSTSNFGGIFFANSATAGVNMIFAANAGTVNGGSGATITFSNTASASNDSYVARAGTVNGALGGSVRFFSNATASGASLTTNGATAGFAAGGFISFFNTADGGTATVTNNAATFAGTATAGQTGFNDSSTADQGNFTNLGSAALNMAPGQTAFRNSSTAANATFTNNGGTGSSGSGGFTVFRNTSTAANATLIANGGTAGGFGGSIGFVDTSTGDTSRVEVFGNGLLDIRSHTGGVSIGSIEGSGLVLLGDNNLDVGGNNGSTAFSGQILNTGSGGLSKSGTGTFTLSGGNAYAGGTVLAAGNLVVAANGALGTGNVSLTGPTVILTLQSGATNDYISDGATLSIGPGAKVNLNFTGPADVVSSLILNGVTQPNGTYDASNESAFLTGGGSITVVPEPASSILIAIGGTLLVAFRRIRRTDPSAS
jgi:hypothetical protein